MSLKKELINGVFWTAIQKYSGLIIQLVVSAVLARLISPADFGVVAIASVIILFLNLFTDMGIGPAIIQKKHLSKDDLNQIYSATIYIGVLFASILFGSSRIQFQFHAY